MLQAIRDRVTGIVAWGIVILISIPFALWGIQESIGADSSVAVATIDGEEVSLPRFQRFYQEQRAQLRDLFGGQLPTSTLEQGLRERALEELIQQVIVLQSGAREGMKVGDHQLALTIQGQPAFQVEGNFSQPVYDQFLQTRGHSPASFEQELRRDLLLTQVTRGVTESALVTAREVERLDELRTQQRSFRVLEIPKSSFEEVELTEEQISGFYDTNRADYRSPETLDIEYVEVSRQTISGDIPVDESDLEALYELNIAKYGRPEQREASHILIRVPADADDGAVEQAREKIQALATRLEEGADFAALAAEHSEDPLSAAEGGSVGAIVKGMMVPVFDDAAFALAEGEISEIVKSDYGFHLIRVDSIQPGTTRSFDEMRELLLSEVQFERAQQDYFHRVEELANLSFEQPESLDAAALALDLEPQRVNGVTRVPAETPDDIAGDPNVIEAAFSADVLEGGNNSELLELDGDRALVLRVAERHPAKDRPLDEVREAIRTRMTDEAAAKQAADAGRALTLALREGRDPSEAAAEHNAEWSETKQIDRQHRSVDAHIVNLLFRMPAPASSGQAVSTPRYDGVATAAGDFAVVELISIGPPQAAEARGESTSQTDEAVTSEVAQSGAADGESATGASQTETPSAEDPAALAAEQTRLALRSTLGRGEYEAYVRALRTEVEVKIHEQSMQ
ncbi:MAG: SurA N-terminal domain-containing protein [Gammaproteobacteria bacterium]